MAEQLEMKKVFKRPRKTMISDQHTDILDSHINNNTNNSSNSDKTKTAENINPDIEILQTLSAKHPTGLPTMDATTNEFELFTRFLYCQALLYKSWFESSDELARKLSKSVDMIHSNSNEITSVYIETFEEKFTELFRSPEFASNLARLINSLLEFIKKNMLEEISLNGLADSSKFVKHRKGKRMKKGRD